MCIRTTEEEETTRLGAVLSVGGWFWLAGPDRTGGAHTHTHRGELGGRGV